MYVDVAPIAAVTSLFLRDNRLFSVLTSFTKFALSSTMPPRFFVEPEKVCHWLIDISTPLLVNSLMHSPVRDTPNQYQSKPSRQTHERYENRRIHVVVPWSYPVEAVEDEKLQHIIRKLGPRLFRLRQHGVLLASFVPAFKSTERRNQKFLARLIYAETHSKSSYELQKYAIKFKFTSEDTHLRWLWEPSGRDSPSAIQGLCGNFLTTNFGIKTFCIKKISEKVMEKSWLFVFRLLSRTSLSKSSGMMLPLISRPANVYTTCVQRKGSASSMRYDPSPGRKFDQPDK